MNRLFLVTGDASGDVHASYVIRALQANHPELEIQAVGGPQVKATGVTLFHDQSQMNVVGLGFIKAIPSHLALGKHIIEHFKTQFKPDVVLLIDYGGFNLRLAKAIKQYDPGIKIFYYIPPQIWASRRGRIRYVQQFVDRVFCIFPFELEFYEEHNVPTTFVGHPLLEELPPEANREAFCATHDLDPNKPIVSLFPGSRKMEIAHLLQPMLQALPLIQSAYGHHQPIQFVLAKAPSVSDEFFNQHFKPLAPMLERLNFKIISGANHEILSLSKAAMVASGTVTLEAALYKTPMVLAYKGPWLAYQLFKILSHNLKYIGLPNLLASKPPIVKELWMYDVTPYQFCDAIVPLLKDDQEYSRSVQQLAEIRSKLGEFEASKRVAEQCLALT